MSTVPEPYALRNGDWEPETEFQKDLATAQSLTQTACEAISEAVSANDRLHEHDGGKAEADDLYRRMCCYLDATPDLDVFQLERRVRELSEALRKSL